MKRLISAKRCKYRSIQVGERRTRLVLERSNIKWKYADYQWRGSISEAYLCHEEVWDIFGRVKLPENCKKIIIKRINHKLLVKEIELRMRPMSEV